MKNRRFWLGFLLAVPTLLSALEITPVSPRDGATVPLLNDRHKAFLAMPRAERIEFFADAEKRKQLVKAGHWPRPVYFGWRSSDAPDGTTCRVLVSEKPDMSDPVAAAGEKGKAKLYNLMLGRTYYWQVEATAPGGKPVLSQVRSFTTEDRAPRLLRFPDVPNVRDLGGRKTKDGRYVKQGLVFRTAGMNDNARKVPVEDEEELLRICPEYRQILKFYRGLQKKLKDDPASVSVVPYSLKSRWCVFMLDKDKLSADEVAQLDALDGETVPETLFGVKRKEMTANKRGRVVLPKGKTPRVAVLMQAFYSPADGIMQIATGGDYYWDLRINGKLVYSRMSGNGKKASTGNYHYFIPVRSGRNLVTVVLKPGRDGWMWCCGKRQKREPAAAVDATIKSILATSVRWQKGKSRVTPEGRAIFLGQYGVRSDIDLRSDGECRGMTGSPLGPEVKWFHISSSAYAGMHAKRGKEQFAKVFRVFLDEKNYPVIFHCIAGQDRTGAVAFILNGLLGVPEEELYLDWEATGFWNRNVSLNHKNRLNRLIDGFREQPGRDINEQIENYVLSCGFTREDIEKFRSIMLEKR